MKKRLPVLLHILLWLVLLGYSLYTHFNFSPVSNIPFSWLALDVAQTFFFHLALFYFNWFVLLPKILAKGNVGLYALAVIVTLMVYAAIRTPIEIFEKNQLATVDKSMANQVKRHPQMVDYKTVMLQLAVFGIMNVFLSSSLKVTGDYLRNERARKELEHRQTATELELLKAQVNPHFLFNTLNNIYSLAYQQAPNTPDAIMKLSLLLRYQLYETDAAQVPLEKELEHLHHLLDLHRLRLPNPELLNLKVDGEVSSVQVPPMLLMPLVENMFKHGLTTAPMTLRLVVENNRLSFTTHNTIKPNAATNHQFGGIGLHNLRRRLELMYAHAFTLNTNTEGPYFKTELILNKLS